MDFRVGVKIFFFLEHFYTRFVHNPYPQGRRYWQLGGGVRIFDPLDGLLRFFGGVVL